MILLILGVALWWLAHLFKRLAPGQRAALSDRMGDASKGLFAGLIVLSIVLMVIGYRGLYTAQVWYPPAWTIHVNNLLVLLAFYLFAASGGKTAITRRIRHPQLTAFKLWAFAHLLVNGDLASIILFGGLLAWAVVEVIVINRAVPAWTPAHPVPWRKEITAIVATVIAFGVVSAIHAWLGYWPFPR